MPSAHADPAVLDAQFPGAWILLLFIGILKFNLSFIPIVILALVFNVTNTIGYTYAVSLSRLCDDCLPLMPPAPPAYVATRLTSTFAAMQDRDAKRRWASGMTAGGLLGSVGGFGGSIVSSLATNAMGRFFR